MSKLIDALSVRSKIMRDIYESFGEADEIQIEALEVVTDEVVHNAEAYAFVITNAIPNDIALIDEKIKELKALKEKLEGKKEYLENILHQAVLSVGHDVVDKKGNIEKVMQVSEDAEAVATLSVKRSVDVDKIDDDYCAFEIDVNTASRDDAEKVVALLNGEGWIAEYNRVPTTRVTDLPENHPAIVKAIRPTIRFRKARKIK